MRPPHQKAQAHFQGPRPLYSFGGKRPALKLKAPRESPLSPLPSRSDDRPGRANSTPVKPWC